MNKKNIKKIYYKIRSLIKYLRYKSYLLFKSINFVEYKNINIDYSVEFFDKNKFIILPNLINREKYEQILKYSYSQPAKKNLFECSLIEHKFDLSIIADKIENARKIISNQQGLNVDVAYDEISLYKTSRIEKADSSFLWHCDGPIFTTSLIHRIGNCKKNEKRIVLTIPFLSEKNIYKI